MKDYTLTILGIQIVENNLTVEAEIQGCYSPSIRSPKLALFFDNGQEIRRVPMQIISYYPEADLQKFVLFAEHIYDLNSIFFDTVDTAEFSLYFEFIYGEDRINKIPLNFQKELKLTKIRNIRFIYVKAVKY